MTREKNSHRRGRVRDVALTIGACAGVLCIVIAAASLFLGITPLVFRSGSMEPEISTGALAFSRTTPADEIAVGDVVSVINTQGTRITHRVYGIAPQSDGVVLTLKGDANAEPDVETYFVTSVDRILFSVDKLGYAVSWASGPIGVFLGGVLAGILLMIAFRPGGPRPNRPAPPSGESIETTNRHVTAPPSDRPSGTTRSGTLVKTAIAGVTLVSVSLGISQTAGTAAAFQDTAGAQSTFSAASVILPRVSSATCATGGLLGLLSSATLTWTAPAGGPYTYRVIVRQNNPSSVASTTDVSSTTTTVSVGLVGLLADGAYTAEIYTKSGTQVSSTFFPVPLTVVTLIGTKCVKEGAQTIPAGFAARLAPAGTPAPTSTTTSAPTTTSAGETTTNTSTSTTESSSIPTTTTETTTTATTTTAPATTTTPPTTTTPTTTTTTTPTTTTSTVVSAGVPSDSGEYFAATDTDGTSRFASITDASGTEAFRTGIEPGDTVHWLTGTNELWILGSSGPRKVSQVAGLWTSTSPTGELPAEIAALVSK